MPTGDFFPTGNSSTTFKQRILQRLSEQDVCEWMMARIIAIRETGLPTGSVSVSAHYSYNEPYITWTAHAAGQCVVACPKLDKALSDLRRLVGSVSARANELRREAAELLKQAEDPESAKPTTL